jgi:hypothetical protein
MDKNEQSEALKKLIANYSKFTQLPFWIIRSTGVVEFPVNDFRARKLPVGG